ncbi:hypothetical protein Y1Q_0000964 [Alligator mississippiensis]|uniref:Uncharacterized protein n=1 Tax=Alligator mississippiensis TaxID=8496 RepID=A0A151NE56_ALLMI|nr:hypothetical protein Y1Q_0000964 [Alligator mississippiensis]
MGLFVPALEQEIQGHAPFKGRFPGMYLMSPGVRLTNLAVSTVFSLWFLRSLHPAPGSPCHSSSPGLVAHFPSFHDGQACCLVTENVSAEKSQPVLKSNIHELACEEHIWPMSGHGGEATSLSGDAGSRLLPPTAGALCMRCLCQWCTQDWTVLLQWLMAVTKEWEAWEQAQEPQEQAQEVWKLAWRQADITQKSA